MTLSTEPAWRSPEEAPRRGRAGSSVRAAVEAGDNAVPRKDWGKDRGKVRKMKTFIIAEAGVNHNGDIAIAHQMVDMAADAGADAVKFQTFIASDFISQAAPKAGYQLATTGDGTSQLEMVRTLELSRQAHYELLRHCQERNISFLSTPFDLGSLDFLISGMRLEVIKIPSGEVTNGPLLVAAGRGGVRIILSTGMCTLEDVEQALGAIAFGALGGEEPSVENFAIAFSSAKGRTLLSERVTLLHCTTEYPAPYADINLTAMATLRERFGLPVGLSDHSVGIAVAIAARALGAAVIEKHFTLDRAMPGPDHLASIEPGDLTAMVASIRQVELAMGKADKAPAPSEIKNIAIARKSLVARCDISQDEAFTKDNLGVKRPGNGISPMNYWAWLGRRAGRDYRADEIIQP